MKRIIMLLLIVMCLFSMIAYAEVYDNRGPILSQLAGTWYDYYGQTAFSVDPNALTFTKGKIYKVVAIEPLARGTDGVIYIFKLSNDGITQSMKVRVDTRGDTLLIALNNDKNMIYQNSKEVKHFESIGGVYLGMTSGKVEQLHGRPDSVKTVPLGDGGSIVYATYSRTGWQVRYEWNRVQSITIYKNGTRRFDRSGLSAANSMADFVKAYNIQNPGPMRANKIHHGEYLWFDQPGQITFSKFNN